jgi:hypothetical protein
MGSSKAQIETPTLFYDPHRHKRTRPTDSEIEKEDNEDYMPRKKQVRFATAASGDLKTTEAYIDILRSDLDKPNMWWSRQERDAITDKCYDSIADFRKDHMDQVRHYLSVFDQCTQTPSQSSSDYLEKATVSLPSYVRGLERGIAPSTKAHRRAHVQEVIEVQEQIQGLSAIMRDQVLSSRALRSSRPCRVMARILGEGDARCDIEESKVEQRRSQCKMIPKNWR